MGESKVFEPSDLLVSVKNTCVVIGRLHFEDAMLPTRCTHTNKVYRWAMATMLLLLTGVYLILLQCLIPGGSFGAVVHRWVAILSSKLTSSKLYKWQWLGLLPDDRLLLDDGSDILLFDLSDAPVSTLPPTQRNQPPRQDALARLQLFMNAISPPYLFQDSIRFTILNNEGVKGLIVPRTRSASRSMNCVDLLSHPNFGDFSHVCYDRAVLCAIQPIVLQFPWPEHSSSVVSQKSTIQMPSCSELLFDEYSSRLVTFNGLSIKRILDLAAI